MVSLVALLLVFHNISLPLLRPANMPEAIFQIMKPWHILSPALGFCVVIATQNMELVINASEHLLP